MKRIGLILFVLLFAALACISPPENEESTEVPVDLLETSVAATLTAIASGEEPPGEAPPGDVPEAPPTDVPTLTPLPPQPLRIAYIDNDNLQLWTEGVGSVMLYTGEKVNQVLLSDDGQMIVFKTVNSNWIPQGMYRINSDGSGLIQLMNAAEFVALSTHPSALSADVYHWAFIPGSYTVMFNTKLVFEGPGLLIQNEIMQVDTSTGMVTLFFAAADGSNFVFSPDGTQLALSDHNSISLINTDGTNLRPDVLTFPQINTASEYLLFPPPTWAPDSSYLRVVIPSAEPWGPGASMTVYNIPTNGSPAASIGVYPGLAFFSFQGGVISPDMQKFVYLTQFGPPANNQYELHIVNFSGATDMVYNSGAERFMGWGPDSEHFVFGSNGIPTMLGRIGFGPMALTDVVTVQSVTWIDNITFLFTHGSHAAWELRLASLGGASSLIASPTADFITYDFSH